MRTEILQVRSLSAQSGSADLIYLGCPSCRVDGRQRLWGTLTMLSNIILQPHCW